MRFDELSAKQIREATTIARKMLEGVGKGRPIRFKTDPPEHAVHVQKPLTEHEIKMLPKGWMEIPAVDDVGPRVIF